jgi:glycosyltransferase involved in cell wall biosynthesis
MQKYYALPSSHIRTIYNPIDIADIRNSAKVAPSHPWLQGQYQVFTAVGRLTPVKDYENLLRAFSIVYRQHPMARLVILGAGPSLESLLELASELDIDAVVDFVGFQSNPYSWVMRSDVYVLSSRSEGLPNALIQALACGVKVVSTDCEHGPSEILEQGRWGRLVPVGDPEALAKEMSSAVLDPSPPDVLTRAERFAVDTVVDEYADVLAVEHRA